MADKRTLSPGVPVVSYPTPNISDLILLEDVDSRLPGYTPLEYGSPHPNAVLYPDLKLVFQTPLENLDTFVRRIYAKDRYDQDAYNYAVKYSAGSPAHPIYIRTYVVPRAEYAPVPEGSADPVYPGAYIVDEEMGPVDDPNLNSLFVKVTRIYETLPGPELAIERYNDRGDLETIIKQTVVAGTDPNPDGLLVTSSGYEPIDSGKGTITTGTVEEYTTLTTKKKGGADLIPARLRAALLTEVTDNIVTPDTQPTDLDGELLESQVQQTTKTKAKKVDISLSGDVTLLNQQKGIWGVEPVYESLTAPGATLSPGFGTKDAKKEDLGNGRAVEQLTMYPESPATLLEVKTDEQTGIRINVAKSLVDPASSLPTVSSTEIVERQSIDKWHSIQIVSSLDTGSLPSPETYETSSKYSFPNELLEVGLVWQESSETSASTTGVENASSFPEDLGWSVAASAKAESGLAAVVYTKVKNGHSGACRAVITRVYYVGPPTSAITATIIQPVYGTVTITGTSGQYTGHGSAAGQGSTTYTTSNGGSAARRITGSSTQIGPFVHSGVTLTNGSHAPITTTVNASSGTSPGGSYPVASSSATASASASLYLPPSTQVWTSGQSLISDVRVEKWRLGVWIREVVTLYHP